MCATDLLDEKMVDGQKIWINGPDIVWSNMCVCARVCIYTECMIHPVSLTCISCIFVYLLSINATYKQRSSMKSEFQMSNIRRKKIDGLPFKKNVSN